MHCSCLHPHVVPIPMLSQPPWPCSPHPCPTPNPCPHPCAHDIPMPMLSPLLSPCLSQSPALPGQVARTGADAQGARHPEVLVPLGLDEELEGASRHQPCHLKGDSRARQFVGGHCFWFILGREDMSRTRWGHRSGTCFRARQQAGGHNGFSWSWGMSWSHTGDILRAPKWGCSGDSGEDTLSLSQVGGSIQWFVLRLGDMLGNLMGSYWGHTGDTTVGTCPSP